MLKPYRHHPKRTRHFSHLIQQISLHTACLPMILRSLWQLKDHLAIKPFCITRKGRFFLSAILKSKHSQALYNGHPCITSMQIRVHTSMDWHTKNKKIADHVQSHIPFQTTRTLQQKEPAIPKEVQRKYLGKHWEWIYSCTIVNGTF